jgi:hypothetical protein
MIVRMKSVSRRGEGSLAIVHAGFRTPFPHLLYSVERILRRPNCIQEASYWDLTNLPPVSTTPRWRGHRELNIPYQGE